MADNQNLGGFPSGQTIFDPPPPQEHRFLTFLSLFGTHVPSFKTLPGTPAEMCLKKKNYYFFFEKKFKFLFMPL